MNTVSLICLQFLFTAPFIGLLRHPCVSAPFKSQREELFHTITLPWQSGIHLTRFFLFACVFLSLLISLRFQSISTVTSVSPCVSDLI